MNDRILDWLMQGDASIRFQTMRDLLSLNPREIKKEQARIALEGWGAKLLSLQNKGGGWGTGIYIHKWISTTYTMLLLRDLGLEPKQPQAIKGARLLLDEGFYKDGGINYFGSINHSEVAVTGMILSILSHFQLEDERLHSIAQFLVSQQLDYGGWFYLSPQGRTDVCFHTTICVLEGLREYEKWKPQNPRAVAQSLARGHGFLLRHELFKMQGTQMPIHPSFLKFAFPTRYRYDVMRVLDHLQDSRARKDPRMEDAVDLLKSRRRKDGMWALGPRLPGRTHFEMEEPGKPSRWNTLRALRILKWWNNE